MPLELTVTAEGQVTLRRAVLDHLGVVPGAKVSVSLSENGPAWWPAADNRLSRGATYVFDKTHVDYAWWRQSHEAGCRFVTRPMSNVPLRRLAIRPVSERGRQEAGIESDWIVDLASQQRARLPIPLRRILLRREDGRLLTILSNEIARPAGEIAALYRKRTRISADLS